MYERSYLQLFGNSSSNKFLKENFIVTHKCSQREKRREKADTERKNCWLHSNGNSYTKSINVTQGLKIFNCLIKLPRFNHWPIHLNIVSFTKTSHLCNTIVHSHHNITSSIWNLWVTPFDFSKITAARGCSLSLCIGNYVLSLSFLFNNSGYKM